MTTPVECGWAGAVKEKITTALGLEHRAQKAKKCPKDKMGTKQLTDKAGCRVALHATKNCK